MVLSGFMKCYMVSFMVYMVVTRFYRVLWFYMVLYGFVFLCMALYGFILFLFVSGLVFAPGPRSVRVKTDPLIESLSGMHFYDTAAYHMG
jgi:hypothetical protein